MKLSIIVAVANNGVIGKAGGLPWYLPAELANFKKVTMGHPIIMGRKTHESIGRALPGRQNIVISRNSNYTAAEGCMLADSLDSALKQIDGTSEAFVIGGESLFEEALKSANKVYLTKVDASIDGDRHFYFDPTGWKQVSSQKHKADEKNKYDYEFDVWERA